MLAVFNSIRAFFVPTLEDLVYYVATLFSFYFMFSMGKKQRVAWIFSCFSNTTFFLYGYLVDSRAIVLTSIVYIILAIRGLYLWRH